MRSTATAALSNLLDSFSSATSVEEALALLADAVARRWPGSAPEVMARRQGRAAVPADIARELEVPGSVHEGEDELMVAVRDQQTLQGVLKVPAGVVPAEEIEELQVMARVGGMVCGRLLEASRQRASAAEIEAIHQVLEGVAASSTAREIAASTLGVIVDAFDWGGGAVVRPVPDSDGEESELLASYGSALDEDLIKRVANGAQGLRGEVVGEVLPAGLTHALVWPIHQATQARLLLYTSDRDWWPGDPGSALAPIAQVASVVRSGLERVEQVAREQEAAEARRANHAKSEFLSRMSHELRTPLNAVLGFTQLLELDDHGEDAMESLAQIRHAGAHLLDLVNEVLDLSRIESGRMSMSLEPLDVGEAVSECVALVQSLADQREVTIHIDQASLTGWWVHADRQRTKQILLNLLSNGVKFNRVGGSVMVRGQPAPADTVDLTGQDEGSLLRLIVEDTGAGIRPDRMARLFVPFERLGADAQGVPGTGLGLALSRRLAEAMHGDLVAESVHGEGTTFTLSLPQAAPALEESIILDQPHTVESGGLSGTVLYIEDNRPNLKLVERILRRRPLVALLAAETAQEGLAMAREHRPDLVLLDLDLPDGAGIDVLRSLRTDPATVAMPVVVVTADANRARVRSVIAEGATDYVTKPFEITRLLSVVDAALEDTFDDAEQAT